MSRQKIAKWPYSTPFPSSCLNTLGERLSVIVKNLIRFTYMLKIYLDWNIISYLKNEKYNDLRAYITQINEFFIFPYSRAHIQDLYQSKSPTNTVKYEQDLNTLSEICQTHLLEYNDSIDAPYPYECTPRQ